MRQRFASRRSCLLRVAFDVGDRWWVPASAGDQDHVQRAVEFSVAAAVEAVADCLSGGGGDRCAAGERAKAASLRMRPGCDQRARAARRRAGRRRARRAAAVELPGQGLDLGFELAFLDGQLLDTAGERAQRVQVPRSSGRRGVGSGRREALQQPLRVTAAARCAAARVW